MKYKCWCKATDREDKEPRYSHNWVSAKRASFKVFEDHIECGSWMIKNSDIESAHLFRTKQMLIPVNVLQIITPTGSYQFGFNPWANPFRHLGVEYSESNIELSYSPFSIALRLLVVAYLGYLAWENWLKT